MGQLFYAPNDPNRKLMVGDNKYSRVIKIPQYIPDSKKPNLLELCDVLKYNSLIRNIRAASIPDDVKEFLQLGATRHIKFNYAKIADYYAHAEPEIQRLMEQSALVIIDVNDAVANGYIKLSKRMEELIDEQRQREQV